MSMVLFVIQSFKQFLPRQNFHFGEGEEFFAQIFEWGSDMVIGLGYYVLQTFESLVHGIASQDVFL